MSSQLKLPGMIREKFRSSTLNFIFILAYVHLFSYIFGPENTIVGVIFTIMMSASMVRDLTATPLRHLVTQALVLVWMALAAYWVNALPAPLSVFVHFITLLGILYAYTYEYSSHMYFPYILSYLFLIFISPVSADQLPGRIAGMLTGALSIILYQLFMGRNRVQETAMDVLSEMIDSIRLSIACRLAGTPNRPDPAAMRSKLCQLSRIVYQRRKKVLCVSDASFYMIDAGRGLEHLLILVHELPSQLSLKDREMLQNLSDRLQTFCAFLHQDITLIPEPDAKDFFGLLDDKRAGLFFHSLEYIRDRLLHMTDPQNRQHYRPTALSLKMQLRTALDLSPVRAVYALRTALILACATFLVRVLSLPHGKWLLFTLASVSLPYADDVPVKIKKRVLATITGGLVSVVIYALIPSPLGRTAAMMLSGYISFYFSDYAQTFACSTVGALGGAVFMDAFGFQAVGSIFLIRLGYILAGAAAGYILNCLITPYRRDKATRQLFQKYRAVTQLLTRVCRSPEVDTQLYYNLVIQAHLQEDKLVQNAHLEKWSGFSDILAGCREQVRSAHRSRITERENAPVFEPGHLS